MTNAGKYRHKITIYAAAEELDEEDFSFVTKSKVLSCYAEIKTLRGMTLIKNGSDFEKAYTNFTIRFPKTTVTRDMLIEYAGKTYKIEYLNNKDEEGAELEIQAKEVTH